MEWPLQRLPTGSSGAEAPKATPLLVPHPLTQDHDERSSCPGQSPLPPLLLRAQTTKSSLTPVNLHIRSASLGITTMDVSTCHVPSPSPPAQGWCWPLPTHRLSRTHAEDRAGGTQGLSTNPQGRTSMFSNCSNVGYSCTPGTLRGELREGWLDRRMGGQVDPLTGRPGLGWGCITSKDTAHRTPAVSADP